jgi:predicted alpha-1,2-mannosidase
MTQFTPQVYDTEKKCLAPYYQGSTMSQGFRGTHWLSGSCVQDYGSFTVFPTRISDREEFRFSPISRQTMFLFNTDNATPAYMSFLYPEKNIMTEITGTKRCGFFRFSWLEEKNPTVIIDVNSDEGEGYIKIDLERNEIYGYNPVHRIYQGQGKPAGISGYFVAHFDHDFVKYGITEGFNIEKGATEINNLKKIGAYVSFTLENNTPLKMKVGTSFTSIENARNNLNTEIPEWDFEATKLALEKTWNETLGTIAVETEDEDELIKFYTSMYHALFHPRLYSDVNGDYPAFAQDHKIKNVDYDYYGDFSNWDIFRAQMPLLSLIAPEQYNNMIKSLITMAEDGDWLPIFPMWNNYTSAMIGDHSTSVIADAAMKDFDFDLKKAYHFMRKNAFESPASTDYSDGKGRRALNSYIEFGYIPLEDEVLDAFHKREQVSRTLEYAYNDWCVAQVAKKLGKEHDYVELMARSANYSNVFDEQVGWMNGRYGDGTFYENFSANDEHFFITEGTSKHYTWYVPHDVTGLMELMGGKAVFSSKLNELISQKEYWHGNEPSHQIPYLFNYANEWELTQKTVKHLLKTEYDVGPGGISGNDDAGQMSAWYVFGAIGFYPVCPGSNEYQLSSPIFEKVTLNLNKKYYPKGKFQIRAQGASGNGIFSSVKLNGKTHSTSILHKDFQDGGKLEFLK